MGVYEQWCIEKQQQQQHIVGGIKKAFNNRAFEFTGRVHMQTHLLTMKFLKWSAHIK